MKQQIIVSHPMKFPAFFVILSVLLAFVCAKAENGLTIISPAGGDAFRVGDTLTVHWAIDSGTYISDALVLEISPDNGINYVLVGSSIKRASDAFKARMLQWAIPDSIYSAGDDCWYSLRSNSCVIYLHGYSDYTIYDYTDGPFTIGSTATRYSVRHNAQAADMRLAGAVWITQAGKNRMTTDNLFHSAAFFRVDGRLLRPAAISGSAPVYAISIRTAK